MSFGSDGVYTPPSGATTATPGAVIRSTTWNSVFGDITAALTQLAQQAWTPGVVTVTTSPYTVSASVAAIVFNGGGTITVTLPTASSYTGRWLRMKTVAAQAVISGASDVAPLTATTAGTAILAATVGKWANMQSDGTSWVIMAAN